MSSPKNDSAHYVVTAHPSGGVLSTAKCNFLSPTSLDVIVAKTNRLEVRQLRNTSEGVSPFPVVVSVPVNGRIVALAPIKVASSETSFVFILTSRQQYAVLAYDPKHSTSSSTTDSSTGKKHNPYPIATLASGNLQDQVLGSDTGMEPLIAVDHFYRYIALYMFDGLITIIPINRDYIRPRPHKGDSLQGPSPLPTSHLLHNPAHCRIEERTVLAMSFLQNSPEALPQIALLHQDARGAQHITSHVVNRQNTLYLHGSLSAPPTTEWLQKSSVDGGSSMIIPLPLPAKPPAAAAPAAATESNEADFYSPTKHKSGGLLVVGQRQLLYCNSVASKVVAIPQALVLCVEELPADPHASGGLPRYLLGDEFGNLHMLTCEVAPQTTKITGLQIDTLGSCTIGNDLAYLQQGLCFVGSTLGDSQLVQIHDEPIPKSQEESSNPLAATTYLSVVEEYTHLGPILDMDLVPSALTSSSSTSNSMAQGASSGPMQSQVVTASGSSLSGSLRIVRNGIGMHESAAVEIPGIQDVWSLRAHFHSTDDAYLVQSFVHETRILGVVSIDDEDEQMEDSEDADSGGGGATLAEVVLAGLDSSCSTLYVRNIEQGDAIVQVTERQIRLATAETLLDSWDTSEQITVAAVNDAGQIVVAQSGQKLLYFTIEEGKIVQQHEAKLDHEISCLDLNPFRPPVDDVDMKDDEGKGATKRAAHLSRMVAVGLWDDYSVRLLSLESGLQQLLNICISAEEDEDGGELNTLASPSRRNRNNMMARSLCLLTLDFTNSSMAQGETTASPSVGVDMLFVGLGDGTLVSFVVGDQQGSISARSRKEVCLGTQRINLVPLTADQGGTCVLATGDRPTVIYLAGAGATSTNNFNPKLCYSNVNLATGDDEEEDDVSRPPSQQSISINVAAPFSSSLLYDAAATGSQRYSLCVADDAFLRMGVIDDIQKLHVTKCRLGMAPRRLVHCINGRLFAVGCIKSGIRNFALGSDEPNMGNCIRFMDDTSFDDIQRFDLEPFEMILSMEYASLRVPTAGESSVAVSADGEKPGDVHFKSFLLVGTAYALPEEDEPSRGRILVFSCQAGENEAVSAGRAVRQVTELSTQGGVYSMCQFYDGKFLCTVGSKTHVAQLGEEAGVLRLNYLGVGHHGHIVSLYVKSLAETATNTKNDDPIVDVTGDAKRKDSDNGGKNQEKLAIVGDLMRSISLIQYYPQHETLEEVARDFTPNWTTAIEMLSDDIYLGAENFCGLYCLQRNKAAVNPEIRCRLDNIGEYHLGELVNKFKSGSLVMPVSANPGSGSRRTFRRANPSESPTKGKTATRPVRSAISVGNQTLFGTAEGSLGVVVGLDDVTSAFLLSLERSMVRTIQPIGNLSHEMYRCCQAENRQYPAHGFLDGDLIETFLDLDRSTMECVVVEMNRDGGWETDDVGLAEGNEEEEAAHQSRPELHVDDILTLVEEISMLH